MQPSSDQTMKMFFLTEEELFETMIPTAHPFRKLNELIDFETLIAPLRSLYSDLGQNGIDVQKGFKALLLQFWEDKSDREIENALRENIAIRWFCGFSLQEKTPDHSYFGKLRGRIGAKHLADTFKRINTILEGYGLFGNFFTFIDASSIVSKIALWNERDQAIADGEEKLNNANVMKYAADKDARFGAKSKTKYWFGYKTTKSVDMRHGLIRKTALTPGNVLDPDVLKSVCPNQGMVFTDKLYDRKDVDGVLKAKGCHAATIRKNNSKRKNRDLDRWRSGVRMPFESVFSKMEKRARYRGLVKNVFQNFFEAITHNLKKAVTILPRAPVTASV